MNTTVHAKWGYKQASPFTFMAPSQNQGFCFWRVSCLWSHLHCMYIIQCPRSENHKTSDLRAFHRWYALHLLAQYTAIISQTSCLLHHVPHGRPRQGDGVVCHFTIGSKLSKEHFLQCHRTTAFLWKYSYSWPEPSRLPSNTIFTSLVSSRNIISRSSAFELAVTQQHAFFILGELWVG